MRTIITVEVSLLIRKVGDTGIKLNFRSKGNIIINDIAGIFGGGGHKFAAGAFLQDGNIEKTKNNIIEQLNKKIN